MQQSHIVNGYVGLFVSTQGDRYISKMRMVIRIDLPILRYEGMSFKNF